jgi:protein-tyrosine kinase
MEKIRLAFEKARNGARGHLLPGHQSGDVSSSNATADGTTGTGLHAAAVHIVSQDSLVEKRIVAGQHRMEGADAFRMLRTQVIQRLAVRNASTLAITSAGVGAGKTLIAANLAVALSHFADYTVLLVDVDLRRPAVHTCFGLPRTRGLSDYLLDDVPVGECLITPGLERLSILPCGTKSIPTSDALSWPQMAKLVAKLKNEYPRRIVLYDLPPLLVTDDALLFLKQVEACLLVVEQAVTRKEDIERCLQLLDDVDLIGTVLNKVRSPRDGYGYGYGHAYGYTNKTG